MKNFESNTLFPEGRECITAVLRIAKRPAARVRLFVFHHAGGAASFFRDWPGELPDSVELCAIQQPGREALFFQPNHSNVETLIDHTLGAITPLLDRPFAFLGHSFGARVAFACTLRLAEEGLEMPRHIFLSGSGAPDWPPAFEIRSTMTDAELTTKLNQLGGLPKELADNLSFLELYLSILRGDIQLMEQLDTDEYRRLVSVPITALGGQRDISVPPESIKQWSRFTSAKFEARFFAGGHFFLSDHIKEICSNICEVLRS